MAFNTIEAATIEEARAIAAEGGSYLVLDSSILQQIEDAEAAGGFQGGMTGNADGAPFSSEGMSSEPSSSASDSSSSTDLSDLEDIFVISIDSMIETSMDLFDVVETAAGKLTGPMILVPTEELRKWLNGTNQRDGA